MKEKITEIITLLLERKVTCATMESCTGGGLSNIFTNIEGASDVFQFGAVTYSNDFKIKMGVRKEIIETYTVYSIETAKEMSRAIVEFAGSNYGIGITGQLRRADKNNKKEEDSLVYYSIYDRDADFYYVDMIQVNQFTREENKDLVIESILDKFRVILK